MELHYSFDFRPLRSLQDPFFFVVQEAKLTINLLHTHPYIQDKELIHVCTFITCTALSGPSASGVVQTH